MKEIQDLKEEKMASEDQRSKYFTMAEIWDEVKKMKGLCLPIAATNLVSYLKGMVSVACMGRLGQLELAGGSLAVGLTNITGFSILSGLSFGLDPLCSQAVGSGNRSLASSALRRTVLLLLLASVPIAAFWSSLRPLLLLLRLDPAVAAVAHSYTFSSLPSLISSSLLLPLRSYLRANSRPLPLAAASAFSSLAVHLPLAPLLSRSIGISGIAISSSIADFATILLLALYFYFHHSCYHPPDVDPSYLPLPTPEASLSLPTAAEGWTPLLRLALLSCLGVCLEWWWYELMTVAAGYLSNPRAALGAAGIVIQTTALLYTLPTTLGAAAATRVGNELGARRPGRAGAAAAAAMGLAAIGSCFSLAWATLCRDPWARVFTGDGDVLKLTRLALPVIGLCELANCPQTTGCGVLRGSARPGIAAAINLFSFYLVGAPVAALLAFGMEMGFVGLCLGLLAAQIVCAVSIMVVTACTDWAKEAQKAEHLVGPKASNLTGEIRLNCK
ncbi:MATE efflux family protein 5 [Apostasia shenzhenica]|uniref:Protein DETOXIFICATION n=1 Tax=Apostasia shenzhenica TaxID=1088818 RepID=A0A2I0AHC6_9ASPA|nr:MATE efflux family protein 5 [Apostasia shenzhenica]